MSKTMIVGARIWDAGGGAPFDGDVLIEGNRVRAVSRVSGQMAQSGCQVIDATGLFFMPGMTEGHAHLSFEDVTSTENLITPPPEEHTSAHRARGENADRSRLHQRLWRRRSQAAARRRRAQRGQCRPPPRPAHPRGVARDHRHRRVGR